MPERQRTRLRPHARVAARVLSDSARPSALDHAQVVVPAGTIDEARRFYGELLGLDELERPPGMGGDGAWYRLGAQELHVSADSGFVRAHRAHPGLLLDEKGGLEELAERLERAGSEVRWDERLPGVRRFYSSDPWGNRIEFLARS